MASTAGPQFHRQRDDAVVALLGQLEPGVVEDPEHRAVLGEDLGVEPGETQAAAPVGQVPQQRGRDAEPVHRVVDEERDLGRSFGRCESAVANPTSCPPRSATSVHDGLGGPDHPVHVGGQRSPAQREEPPVHAVVARALVQGEDLVGVVLGDRAEHGAGPVGEQDVGAFEDRRLCSSLASRSCGVVMARSRGLCCMGGAPRAVSSTMPHSRGAATGPRVSRTMVKGPVCWLGSDRTRGGSHRRPRPPSERCHGRRGGNRSAGPAAVARRGRRSGG